MKPLLLAFFFLIIPVGAVAQAERTVCPELKVIGPAGLTKVNEPMRFVLEITGGDVVNNLKYEWSVRGGEIIGGQGTRALEATSSIAGANVAATVTVKGLPTRCTATGSEVGPIEPELIGEPVDSFGRLTVNLELSKYDGFFTAIFDNPGYKGLFEIHAAGRDYMAIGKRRIRKIIKHAEFRKFDVTRLIFYVCGPEETSTVLWTVPPDARLPKYLVNCRQIRMGEL